MRTLPSGAILGAALILSSAAQAQPAESVVVTATRLGVSADGANVDVLDAAAIAARDPASVVDLLRDLPGVFVQQQGRGSVVSLFTRGAKPNFTLVLLDGVKANDPTNTRGGSYDFSTLDLNDIERIEFVRGPASAIYGSRCGGRGDQHHHPPRRRRRPRRALMWKAALSASCAPAAMSAAPSAAPPAIWACPTATAACRSQGSDVQGTNLDGALALPQMSRASISA